MEKTERSLTRETLPDDPVEQFRRWFAEARSRSGRIHPESTTLSTVDADGWPQGRVVLLKGFDDRGFVFYTNLESTKARALEAHPRAALTFHWESLGRQVRVEGDVAHVPDAEADAYFASRPRGSQIGAWASPQSEPLPSRNTLEDRVAAVTARFEGQEVPRPPFWGGYRVRPLRMEFWQDRSSRLHDRFLYVRGEGAWSVQRLAP